MEHTVLQGKRVACLHNKDRLFEPNLMGSGDVTAIISFYSVAFSGYDLY